MAFMWMAQSRLALIAFILSALSVLFAHLIEVIGGYAPCELCLQQRMAHYIGASHLALCLFLIFCTKLATLSPKIKEHMESYIIFVLLWALIAYVISVLIAFNHWGIELGLFDAVKSCTSLAHIKDVDAARMLELVSNKLYAPCERPALAFLGISLSAVNGFISLFISYVIFNAVFNRDNRN